MMSQKQGGSVEKKMFFPELGENKYLLRYYTTIIMIGALL